MTRAIFFDCFGVLYVDVSHAYFANFPQYREELYDLNKQSDHGFIDKPTYIAAVAKITGISEGETAAAFAKEHMINQPLVSYIRSQLKPNYKIGMISNIGRGWINDFFDEHQLHDLFDVTVLSGEEGITKPNPLIFERATRRICIPADETIFIDDIKENCEGAELAGMRSLLYTSPDTLQRSLRTLLEGEI